MHCIPLNSAIYYIGKSYIFFKHIIYKGYIKPDTSNHSLLILHWHSVKNTYTFSTQHLEEKMTLSDLAYSEKLERYRKELNLESFKFGRIISEHKERYHVKTDFGEFESELLGNLRYNAE